MDINCVKRSIVNDTTLIKSAFLTSMSKIDPFFNIFFPIKHMSFNLPYPNSRYLRGSNRGKNRNFSINIFYNDEQNLSHFSTSVFKHHMVHPIAQYSWHLKWHTIQKKNRFSSQNINNVLLSKIRLTLLIKLTRWRSIE